MLRDKDWEDVLREDKRQDDKWGSQIYVPLGTGPNTNPMFPMVVTAQSRKIGRFTAGVLRDLAKKACQDAFNDPNKEGTWVGILLEEVFEAFAEEGGVIEGEPLEEELLQVATVALKMRQAARHHRIVAGMEAARAAELEKYGQFEPCGHKNYGTKEDPATVYANCPDCGKHYCDQCNYDRHICGGCGDPYRHGEGPHEDGKWCIDLPGEEETQVKSDADDWPNPAGSGQ